MMMPNQKDYHAETERCRDGRKDHQCKKKTENKKK